MVGEWIWAGPGRSGPPSQAGGSGRHHDPPVAALGPPSLQGLPPLAPPPALAVLKGLSPPGFYQTPAWGVTWGPLNSQPAARPPRLRLPGGSGQGQRNPLQEFVPHARPFGGQVDAAGGVTGWIGGEPQRVFSQLVKPALVQGQLRGVTHEGHQPHELTAPQKDWGLAAPVAPTGRGVDWCPRGAWTPRVRAAGGPVGRGGSGSGLWGKIGVCTGGRGMLPLSIHASRPQLGALSCCLPG